MWNDHLEKREGKEGQASVRGGKYLPPVIICIVECFVNYKKVYINRKYDLLKLNEWNTHKYSTHIICFGEKYLFKVSISKF